eukprot:m.141432 g.141432  ORF g.141432 m.141432 type:complete len:258 (-) comp22857_c0_seq2:719-1492(-)
MCVEVPALCVPLVALHVRTEERSIAVVPKYPKRLWFRTCVWCLLAQHIVPQRCSGWWLLRWRWTWVAPPPRSTVPVGAAPAVVSSDAAGGGLDAATNVMLSTTVSSNSGSGSVDPAPSIPSPANFDFSRCRAAFFLGGSGRCDGTILRGCWRCSLAPPLPGFCFPALVTIPTLETALREAGKFVELLLGTVTAACWVPPPPSPRRWPTGWSADVRCRTVWSPSANGGTRRAPLLELKNTRILVGGAGLHWEAASPAP